MKLGSLRNCLPGAGCLARPDSAHHHQRIFFSFIKHLHSFPLFSLMTIAGVHDTTLNTGIMSGPISSAGIRQHSPAMQSAECGVWSALLRLHRSDVRGDTSCLCLAQYCHLIPCLGDHFIFCLLVSVDCDVRRGHRWPVSWSAQSLLSAV